MRNNQKPAEKEKPFTHPQLFCYKPFYSLFSIARSLLFPEFEFEKVEHGVALGSGFRSVDKQ